MTGHNASSLYSVPLTRPGTRMAEAIAQGLAEGNGAATIFFRADDIGVPSRTFFDMLDLFRKHDMPLNLAVVPAWLTGRRWQYLKAAAGDCRSFSWHQHGWLHRNHEPAGKKQEFGESRAAEELERDLLRGRVRLLQLMGRDFYPFFTPPWNRCGMTTLNLLRAHGFKGISRSTGARPAPPPSLPDISVNVDLHTRKEADPDQCLAALLAELHRSMAAGTSGIMLHHQRMNDQALLFLETLLTTVHQFDTVQPLHFADMA